MSNSNERREAQEDSFAAYHTREKHERDGIALCLSGGAFRAGLFHLGATRRLNELAILSRVKTISSVSGGSLLAAHLAERVRDWPAPGEVIPDWDTQIAAPFHEITGQNLRTGPILRRLFPWNWGRPGSAINTLARRYQKEITDLRLGQLPDRPNFIFCSTDMVYGRFWVFQKEGVGRFDSDLVPKPNLPVARGVAASSCFPPVFTPMNVSLAAAADRPGAGHARPPDKPAQEGHLTDGGTYDNTGVEAVWEDHATLLVSNGGGTFDTRWRDFWLWRLRRYPAITDARVRLIQQRWLFTAFRAGFFDGAVWGIDTPKWDQFDVDLPVKYPRDLVEEVIAQIRTDLDAFSEPEQKVLENHGYLMAEASVRALLPDLPRRDAPVSPPYPEWMDPERVRHALADSDKRRILGRPYDENPLDILFD